MGNKYFYAKIAFENIKKNSKTYIPYILTVILNVGMFYIVHSLSQNKNIDLMIGADTIRYFLSMGNVIIAIFSFIFLFYTNSFLMKRRNKEFGLFNILGMEKRHILKIIALETLYIMFIGIIGGILSGILLDKLMYLCIGRMFQTKVILGFYISFDSIITTIILFSVIFFFIYLRSRIQIRLSNPTELLKSSSVGEKEPRTKWLSTIIGMISLFAGYYIAITTKNPLTAFGLFFVAVICVIIGTYLLFSSGSIALLKGLKKNKNYYYQSYHFISVSGMIYRMKQNAVGLANICVLCTMVLVMISSTISLWVGIDNMIDTKYPREIVTTISQPNVQKIRQLQSVINQTLEEKNAHKKDELTYTYLTFTALNMNGSYSTDTSYFNVTSLDKIENLFFLTLDEYQKINQDQKTLKDDEVLLYTNRGEYEYSTIKLFDHKYKIKEKLDDFINNGYMASDIATSQFIVVKDEKILNELYEKQKEVYQDKASKIRYYYGFNTDKNEQENKEIYNLLLRKMGKNEFNGSIESRSEEKGGFIGLFAGLLFLGIFLSVLFMIAAILIIYYKQISEGYEDKERFEIMQKVGMDQTLVKKSIRSQILTVFLLPPVVAGIHVIFAFSFVSKILEIFGLTNIRLYALTSFVCFIIFLMMYIMIYLLTAKSYYHIVKR